MQAFRRQLRLLVFLLCLSVAFPYAALAQTSAPAVTPAPLPPEAQAALKKGIVAAQEQEWSMAIQSFQEARKTAPDAPVLFYNLGLAESKIPGRELRAIAWFGAYLAASPNAPNAGAVNDAIVALQIKNQGNLNRLIETALAASGQIQQDNFSKDMDLARVLGLLAEAGDVTASLRTLALMGDDDREIGYEYLTEGQAKAGDVAGAQKSATLIRNGIFKCEALGVIESEQVKAGDNVGAHRTFVDAMATADHIHDGLVNGVQTHDRFQALDEVASLQAKLGDIVGAQQAVDSIQDANFRAHAQNEIVEAQRTSGDFSGAQKTIDLMLDGSNWKQNAQLITWARFPKVNVGATQPVTSDWLKKLDDENKYNDDDDDCALNADAFLGLAGYLTVQSSEDPHKMFYALIDTATRLLGAQHVINRMLKQQARK